MPSVPLHFKSTLSYIMNKLWDICGYHEGQFDDSRETLSLGSLLCGFESIESRAESIPCSYRTCELSGENNGHESNSPGWEELAISVMPSAKTTERPL